MRDLDKALADIGDIRSQIAASTAFRGLGPAGLASTGVLALAVAAAQSSWSDWASPALNFFAVWALTACASAAIIAIEMVRRAQKHHSGIADAMIHNAVLHFIPSGVAGVALLVFSFRFAPEAMWMLPGLWQLLVGLGLFASLGALPRATVLAAAWYFLAGFATLLFASADHALSPWAMGLPFGVGQLILAAIVYRASEDADVR